MMDMNAKRVLVTGGSSGIGLEIARELLRAGAVVGIVGRRQNAVTQAIADLSGLGTIHGCAADVTTTEGRARTLDLARHASAGSTSSSTMPEVSEPAGWKRSMRTRSARWSR